ncbi:hypothetical protein Tco_1159643, partial [Tanacetum coccineum]
MQAARDRQKSYADLKCKPMEFQVGDKVMPKVLPWKGVVRFGKRGKLNPRYVGPFKVIEKVREVAYKLELLEELSKVHNIFHVSNLKKCYADEPLAVQLDGLHFDDKLQFVEEPVEIMDREVKRLKRSRIPLVKAASDDLRDTLSVIYLTYAHSSIPSEDPYEEATRQLLEQEPRSLEYIPDPIKLEDHVPVYIQEPEHPEDLVPSEDEAPTPPLPPFFLSLWTPPLLPIPLPAPSTSRRADIPDADTPPRKRLLLTVPIPRVEVGESSTATASRQLGSTMARRVYHSFVDTRVRDTE